MKRRRIDSQVEKNILIGMITSKEFLSQVPLIFDIDYIEAQHFKQVARWCFDYYKEYQKAPGKNIESIYHGWVESQEDPDEDLIDAIHDFLEHLSNQYDSMGEINVPYLLDETSLLASRKRLLSLKDNIEHYLSRGEVKQAISACNEFRTPILKQDSSSDPLNDVGFWDRVFADSAEPIITFSKDMGSFINKALTRDALVGVQAPEKTGKTWFCVEMVMRALRNRLKVALFEVGDMSESQIGKRLGVRLTGKPLYEDLCGEIEIPKRILFEKDGDGKLETEVVPQIVVRDSIVTKSDCLRAVSKFTRVSGRKRGTTQVMFSVHPNGSINVRGIEGILDRWAIEKDFIPDVIIIDYGDILAPEEEKGVKRDQINQTWQALRRLSQERHALVIVPTQADAGSYGKKGLQDMSNFSEDKRKYAHVTAMLGLNQTEEEKEKQIMRLNWLVLRESPFSSKRCLYIGQCLPLGRFYTCGSFARVEEDD